MAANSTLYHTALESIFDDLLLDNSSPGFRCFSRYAKHNSSALLEAAPMDLSVPKKKPSQHQPEEEENKALSEPQVKTEASRPLPNYISQPLESTPKRTISRIRQFNLVAEHLKIAIATRPPKPDSPLTPRSLERKKMLDLMNLRHKALLESKRTRRTSLRV